MSEHTKRRSSTSVGFVLVGVVVLCVLTELLGVSLAQVLAGMGW